MKNFALALVFFLAISAGAKPEPTKDEYTGLSATSAAVKELETELKKLRESVELTRERVDFYERQTKNEKAEAAKKEYKERLDGAESDLKLFDENVKRVEGEIKQEQDRIGRVLAQTPNWEAMIERMKTTDLNQKVGKLSNEASILDLQLEALERRMDQLPQGAYLREKLARMMSSDFFCHSIQRNCMKTGEPLGREKISEGLGEVFFTPEGELHRSRSGVKSPNKPDHSTSPFQSF